jgi:non-ribosomal peptide synthetase-like protein
MSVFSDPVREAGPQVPEFRTQPLGILHEIFETQADRYPKATAVVFGRQHLTYADLEGAANRLARYLRAMGIRRGSVVALFLPRSLDSYVALLGILKAGAAYVPIDFQCPGDRAAYILENSGAELLVTTANLAAQLTGFDGNIFRMDADWGALASESAERLSDVETGVQPEDPCYIIYTSGSTGHPKGVIVEHRNAWQLVRAEAEIYGARPDDRVYQGASLAFDLSVEEIWIAFQSGATLVAATPEMMRAGPDLSRMLSDYGVTILSCVPTLLAMLDDDVPTLRLLILGGETCPPDLVRRWARPGLRVLNTYGPTETTVIATYAELSPDSPVTIGRAVPGYRVYLLDENLKPVPRGQVGEICIGGAGVARGYVGLPKQTRERFVRDPFASLDEVDARIYRSGDLARMNVAGDLEFMGRADSQVKLRGFRIELGEIEAAMVEADSAILAAACRIWHDETQNADQLVGYIVAREGSQPDEENLRAYLRSHLPHYMVPAAIETLAEMPVLPSGKLNRAALPAPQPAAAKETLPAHRPLTPTELSIAGTWKTALGVSSVLPDDDFFLDLGGDSLRVARMVSELRALPKFAAISVADVYDHPTLASLAAAVDAAGGQVYRQRPEPVAPGARRQREATEGRRYVLAGLAQSVSLYFMFGMGAVEWITPYLLYLLLVRDAHSPLVAAVWAAASAAAIFPVFLLVALAAKWLLLGRIRPGRYPLWGWYYLRWWFVQNMAGMVPLDYLGGTPLLPYLYRLFGVRVGKDVHLASDGIAAFDLISIGDGSSVSDESSLAGFTVEDGELIIGEVKIGRRCFVGGRAVLGPDTVMEDGARLEDLSLLPSGARIPAGETWAGSPARRVIHPVVDMPPAVACRPVRRFAASFLYVALALAFPIMLLTAILPGMILLLRIDLFVHPLRYFAAAPVVGASFVLLLMAEVVVFKWLLVGRVRPGVYRVDSAFYLRYWCVEQLRSLSLDLLGPLHSTLYLAPWYRALGARLGRFVEVSTATSTSPDLLEIDDGGTVADEASLGTPHIEGGWMKVMPTRLGRRAFVGNSGMLPGGSTLGEGSLIGVLSMAPAADQAAMPHRSWLGSPPILLPRRQVCADFGDQRTYTPPRRLRLARAAFELLRVTLPPAGFIIVAAIVIESALMLLPRFGIPATLLLLPLIYGVTCVAVLLGVALVKWSVIGRFRPFVRPLWSNFIWRLELQNALYEFLATPLVLDFLRGTPFISWYLRLLGARIGSRVYVGTTGFLEFDLTSIGDRTALNEDCILQTHLFEDRIQKASEVHVGADCKVGSDSVVLYDSKMEDGARLEDLSLLMKGETLLGRTTWVGIPAERADGRSICLPRD